MSAKKQPTGGLNHIPTAYKYPTIATTITATGILLAVFSQTILASTPITAIGISTTIIGAVTYAITKGQPKIPPQASDLLLQSGIENTSVLVEEIGLRNKAIYLPSKLTGEKPKALIPLDTPIELGKRPLPRRLIIKYGPKTTEMGLLIITPGSAIQGMVEQKPDYSAADIESAVSHVLVGILCLADGIKVTINNDRIFVEAHNPRLENKNMWIFEIIGTPIASIIASVVAEVTGQKVTIHSESNTRHICSVELKILEREQ